MSLPASTVSGVAEPHRNSLYFGDCLNVMQQWPEETVDLCYLDPPFNSKTDYNVLFGSDLDTGRRAQIVAFEDTWSWSEDAVARVERLTKAAAYPERARCISGLRTMLGPSGMLAYLAYMAERLSEVQRLLKPSGSVYLHCDPTASHYLKATMDAIFGASNFRNEIVWRIGWVSGFKTQKRGWIRNHDTLLYYVKSPQAVKRFNKEHLPYPEGYLRRDGNPPRGKGIPVEDTWNCHSGDVLDSIMIKSFSREKLGYPTQKPVALLERIIKASSNPGDLVLDPFLRMRHDGRSRGQAGPGLDRNRYLALRGGPDEGPPGRGPRHSTPRDAGRLRIGRPAVRRRRLRVREVGR